MESYGSYKYSHKRSDIAPLFREFGYKEIFNKDDIHILNTMTQLLILIREITLR